MRIVALANQKGGVGKTTTAVNVAAALAIKGHQVLLVDIDPQGNAGMHLLGPEVGTYEDTIYQVLKGEVPLRRVLRSIPTVAGLSLLPSNITLSGAEAEFLSAVGRERLLADALADLKEYD